MLPFDRLVAKTPSEAVGGSVGIDQTLAPLVGVMTIASCFTFLTKPLVKRFDSLGEINRSVSRAVVFKELQLIEKPEGSGIEVQASVHAWRPSQQDAAHKSLRPRQIIPSNYRIGPYVICELLARRRAQADDLAFCLFCSRRRPIGRRNQTCRRQDQHHEQSNCDLTRSADYCSGIFDQSRVGRNHALPVVSKDEPQ